MPYNHPHIILASGSPRRRQMLDLLKLSYSIEISTYEEDNNLACEPFEIVKTHAKNKVLEVAQRVDHGVIIGADTLVALDGKVFGKPQNMLEAQTMLLELQGTKHQVFTGVAIFDTASQKLAVDYEATWVEMRRLTLNEIKHYFTLINPLDKAGAYAIQDAGSLIIERIEGCFYNVLGFPIVKIDKLLRPLNFSLFCEN